MNANEYQCAECGGVFEKGWTDEEAQAEAVERFGTTVGVAVCDDCYNKIMSNMAARLN